MPTPRQCSRQVALPTAHSLCVTLPSGRFLVPTPPRLSPVQAYMLNPAIYSAHLKLHPLMVLSTLVVAEHNMGVWGLLLAVPMTVFALDYLIRYPDSSVTEVGAKELEKVRAEVVVGWQTPSCVGVCDIEMGCTGA